MNDSAHEPAAETTDTSQTAHPNPRFAPRQPAPADAAAVPGPFARGGVDGRRVARAPAVRHIPLGPVVLAGMLALGSLALVAVDTFGPLWGTVILAAVVGLAAAGVIGVRALRRAGRRVGRTG